MVNNFFRKAFISVESLTMADVELVFAKAREMKNLVEKKGGDRRLEGRVMATLFYEPSSRTFSSFISAMQRLGGGIIPLSGMNNTSVAKGETFFDTVKVFSRYADILVIRHSEPGSAKVAAEAATVPVINAGDGIGEHPTQALIDLFCVKESLGKIEGLNFLIIGDLGHYRPTNSLLKLLCLYKNNMVNLVTLPQVPLQDGIRSYLKKTNLNFREYNDFRALLPQADVLYVTRVKKEYMEEALYEQVKSSYIVDKTVTAAMKEKSLIMHCLPRIDEISKEVDSDKRSIYLNNQVRNGLYLRMALLDLILRK